MRVAQMIDSLAVGGAERLQVTFAEASLARGEIPVVIVLSRQPHTPIPDRLRALGVRLVEMTGHNLVDPHRFRRLVAFLRAERFDAIHAHLTYAIILGGWAGLLARTPMVASLHNIQPDEHAALEQVALLLRAKRVIAVGDAVSQAYRQRLPGRHIQTIYNPVAPGAVISASERIQLRRELDGDERRPLLICVGRLEPQKGMFDLLGAMNHLRATHPEAVLVIVGQGALKEQLQQQIEALNLQNHARLAGMRSDVPRLLAASDVFVSASHWEGMPVSVLEAMAARLPVVATRVGDVPQVVTPETGLLVPPRAPRDLAEAVRSLLDEPSRRDILAANGLARVQAHHSPERWLEALNKVYASV